MHHKSLTTYLDEPYAKLWIDEFVPCIFTLLLSPVSIVQLNQLAEIKKTALARLLKQKKQGHIYFINNFYQCSNLTEQIIDHYLNQIVNQELNTNKIHKLLVIPKCEISAYVLNNSLLKFSNPRLEIFSTFEDALDVINKKNEVLLEEEQPSSNFPFNIFKI